MSADDQKEETQFNLEEVKSKYSKGLTWRDFCKAYAEEHGCNYLVAVAEAGPIWKAYKEAYEVTTSKDKAKLAAAEKAKEKETVVKVPTPKEVSYKEVPTRISQSKKNPGAKIPRKKVSVPAPPKGYRLKTKYVKVQEPESEEEPSPEDLARALKLLKMKAATKPVKKSAVPKRKRPAPVYETASETDSDDYDTDDE